MSGHGMAQRPTAAEEDDATPPQETSVSTHVLDTAAGSPATGVPVALAVRSSADGEWIGHATAATDADGRCRAFPPLPAGTGQVRLRFDTGGYLLAAHGTSFFPEATVVFAVRPGEHHHVPLLLSPFGYSVYRGS